jgi:hypothetical protein
MSGIDAAQYASKRLTYNPTVEMVKSGMISSEEASAMENDEK